MLTLSNNINGNDDDIEVVENVLRGDVEAFSSLVRKYQKKMINTAYRMTGSYEDACDIVQDSFIAAYKALSGFRREASFQTWLTGIVMNNTRNRMKQRKVRESVTVSLGGTDEQNSGCPELPSGDRSAFEELDRREIQQGIEHCLGTLGADFREVIVLRDIRQHSYTEISAMLGLADGTVKSRLARAREMMKDCLRKIFGSF